MTKNDITINISKGLGVGEYIANAVMLKFFAIYQGHKNAIEQFSACYSDNGAIMLTYMINGKNNIIKLNDDDNKKAISTKQVFKLIKCIYPLLKKSDLNEHWNEWFKLSANKLTLYIDIEELPDLSTLTRYCTESNIPLQCVMIEANNNRITLVITPINTNENWYKF